MKIDQLPVEMLFKICSYLPRLDSVSLVNKQFYNVVCSVNDSLHLHFTDNVETNAALQCLMKTDRNISKVSLSRSDTSLAMCEEIHGSSYLENDKRVVMAVVEKFSETIKYFRLKNFDLTTDDFLEILSMLPNVEHLVFERIKLEADDQQPQDESAVLSTDDSLNLLHLKTLGVYWSDDNFMLPFNRLPAGVLTELHFDNLNLHKLTTLMEQQTNITKLIMNYKYDQYFHYESHDEKPMIAADIFDNLRLESLELRQNAYNWDIATILEKQSNLKRLCLFNRVDESLVNFVSDQMTQLEKLSLEVTETPVEAFVNIKKLQKLTDLKIQSSKDSKLLFDALFNYPITELDIDFHRTSDDRISTLAKSFPKLKVLDIKCSAVISEVLAILENFNFVKCLRFKPSDGITSTIFPIERFNLHSLDCSNPELTEFDLFFYSFPYQECVLKKMISWYPNLRKLFIKSSATISASNLELILEGFPKLDSLALYYQNYSWYREHDKLPWTIDDLLCLKDYNLKFVYFGRLKVSLARVDRKFRTEFGVVKKFEKALCMAVDRKTFNSERIGKQLASEIMED